MSPAGGRSLTVVVNGTPYAVEVGDLMAWPLMVTVNGAAYQVEIEPTGSGLPGGAAAGQHAPDDVSPVAQDGPAAGPGPGATTPVRAPMPGSILAVSVGIGDRVTAGQQLCVLEAMKMRNAIRAARGGVVAEVAVAPGQTVAYGDVLFTLA